MNKNTLYIVIAVLVGLLGGWLIFSGNETGKTDTAEAHDHSAEDESQMWTCSMHPQIMQPEPGDCPICGMDLIPADSGADGLAADEFRMTENAMALADIQTTIVGNNSTDGDGTITLSGKIAQNEDLNSVQASYFDGRIERLNVTYEGQQVNRGQLLATIYAPALVAAQQELITAATIKETQPALYKAVRNKLKNWKLTESQIDAIETSGSVRDNFPLHATVSGTVTEVMAAQGDYVKAGQPIARLSDLSTVWGDFDAYESQLEQFQIGQKIMVTSNAYPNKEFEAQVSFIDPILNTQTRTVTVRATLQNKDGLLKPGMFVQGIVKGTFTPDQSALIIPASAVMWTGKRSLVYLKVNPNEPVFKMREVTLGNRLENTYTIISGLESGDEIVTKGTFTVDAAAQLQGNKSMMNQTGQEPSITNMDMSLPRSFQEEFMKALPSYFQLKDALVKGNAYDVSAFAKASSKKMSVIAKKDLDDILESHLTKSIDMLDAIASNSDLENQRDHFVILNENLVAIASNLDDLQNTLYVQECPMANNNKGAVWLSAEEEIRNPYYGDAMLTCGAVIDRIK
ncbi:efflux transporter periplasmic adaptor subunit [Nonlabens tegetincola]|uniref:efflux RND transporter periplasmic adaptor subunit n=1 Tax=Nonlabens tegetincola TaxID=323273 RepID=UPI000A206B91|nr:efflux RND transporter periplasmic adaptor subunit [Nonlabens tegetincola]ARN70635.1 efflux transporter periplasmic adaptor subunit [Nonlabens tegetincola]